MQCINRNRRENSQGVCQGTLVYLLPDAAVHSFSKAKLEENCELRKTVFICIICDWTGLILFENDFKWHFANCVMNSQVTSQIAPFNYPM